MKQQVKRSTVDLSEYPDLIMVQLGMRANTLKGMLTMLRFRGRVKQAIIDKPEGLLSNEAWMYSLRHIGLRQYWRDFESLETWARSLPHKQWWQGFLRDPEGCGFYHELYARKGGMEGMYVDMTIPLGFLKFATEQPARGPMFSARTRLEMTGEANEPPALTEEALYGPDHRESVASGGGHG